MQENTASALRLWSWLLSGLAVLVLSIVCAVWGSAKYTAITTQLVGSVLTLFGLLFAYLRANHRGNTMREQVREFFLRLVGKQRFDVHVAMAPAHSTGRLSAYAEVVLTDRPDLELQEQIDQLAAYIRNHVMGNFKQAFERMEQLQCEVDRAHVAAAEKSAEAYNKAKAEMDQLRRELDQTQVLDLRWAIFGIYIATIGVVLSFWAG